MTVYHDRSAALCSNFEPLRTETFGIAALADTEEGRRLGHFLHRSDMAAVSGRIPTGRRPLVVHVVAL